MLKVIVAGSRTFNDYEYLSKELDIRIPPFIEEIVSGDARGADRLGARWAQEHGFNVKHFPAKWDEYGKAAGIIRNHQMGDYADSLIAFWDGKSNGTKDMINYMREKGKHVEVVNNNTMKIAILGPWQYNHISSVMEELISESQCFLFTVVCGGTQWDGCRDSVGYKWASANGAPIEFLVEENIEKLLDKVAATIDFAVALYDGKNQFISRLIMKLKSMGKHGKVVKI